MKQRHGNKSALFSPAALALAVALACWGFEALATNPVPGVDVIVRKKPGGIALTPTSDKEGKFSVKLAPGDYTVSTGCKSGACTPSQLQLNLPGAKQKVETDGSISYEFHVGKSGLELQGQTLSLDLPKGANAPAGVHINNDGLGQALKTSNHPPVAAGDAIPFMADGTFGASASVSHLLAVPNPNTGNKEPAGLATGGTPIQGTEVGLEGLPGIAGQPISGTDVGLEGVPSGVRVNSKTDDKGAFNFSKLPEGNYTLKIPGLPDQQILVGLEGKVGGNLMKGDDGKFVIFDRWGNLGSASANGDANEAGRRQYQPLVIRKKLDKATPAKKVVNTGEIKAQITALQTSNVVPPPSDFNGDGKSPTRAQMAVFLIRAKMLEDTKDGTARGINVKTEQSAANGAFTFTGLPSGNYVVEILDAAGKIVGTSASIAVGAGGNVGGKVGTSEGGAGYTFFDVFTDVSADGKKPAGNPSAVGDSSAPGIINTSRSNIKRPTVATEPPLEEVSFTHGRVPPPKIGNDAPVADGNSSQGEVSLIRGRVLPKGGEGQQAKGEVTPVGFGSGGPNSPGSAPIFGGPNGPGPSMILVPPPMPSMGGPAGTGPMSPAGPMGPGGTGAGYRP